MSTTILMKGISRRKHKPMSKKRKTSKPVAHKPASKRRPKARKPNRIWLWAGLGLVVIAILAAIILLKPNTAQVTEISPAQAYQKYQQGAFFLDVRSQAEWDQAHIANSTLIPLDELQNHLSELPRDRDIVVVCLTGHRSQEGMQILQQAGFSRAVCMTGGLTAWDAAGYPLESSSP
jgi:rhodanese-related sulfurtransferase